MPILRRLAIYVFSSLFILSLYLAITSYNMNNLIQKESIKSFVESQLTEELNQQKCDEYCNNSESEMKQACMNACLSQFSNVSKNYVYDAIEDVYDNKVFDDISLNDVLSVLENTILFFVLAVVFGFLTFLVSEKPISKLGNNVIVVAISLLSIGVIPVFIIMPEVPVLNLVYDYVMSGLTRQLIYGVVLLVIGIVLLVINYLLEKRKKQRISKK